MLERTLFKCYCTEILQLCCRLNAVCNSEHCVEDTAHQNDSVILGKMECIAAKIMWSILHNRWTVVF